MLTNVSPEILKCPMRLLSLLSKCDPSTACSSKSGGCLNVPGAFIASQHKVDSMAMDIMRNLPCRYGLATIIMGRRICRRDVSRGDPGHMSRGTRYYNSGNLPGLCRATRNRFNSRLQGTILSLLHENDNSLSDFLCFFHNVLGSGSRQK